MNVDDLADNVLDGAYAASWDNRDFSTATHYEVEIITRLMSPWSFVGGLFGAERFPLYAARSNFSQERAAKESAKTATDNVVMKATSFVKIGSFGVVTALAVGVVFYLFLKEK